jgi:hypothetical protein
MMEHTPEVDAYEPPMIDERTAVDAPLVGFTSGLQ